jgi:tetratricopeptide (TPR) repeat protein
LQKIFDFQAAQLTEAEREIVDMAATEGELFSTATVGAALGKDQADVEACCQSLVARQLILKRAEAVRFPDGGESSRYLFLHVLCRDALYRHLPPAKRRRLHGDLGRAIERIYAADPDHIAVELAGHFELGGLFTEAIGYLRRAVDGAASRFANREAARHLERAIELVARIRSDDRSELYMDLLEQRALMRMSMLDLEGAVDDFTAIHAEAGLARDVNRQAKALLDSVMPLGFLDFGRSLAVIEEAQQLKSRADPVVAALADVFRAGIWAYHFGWSQELQDLLDAALPTLNPVTDPATRCRFLWMEAFVRASASDFAGCCRAAEEFRSCAREAGSFHQYFLAMHNLVMGLTYAGNLGEAMRAARAGAELAATNHHYLENLMLESYQAFIAIEAFDFNFALPICERLAREPVIMRFRLTPHIFLWPGLAHLGTGAIEEASDALMRLSAAMDAGGLGFEYRFPLLQGQASCAFSRGDYTRAKDLVWRSIRLAEGHRAAAHAARGYRLLSEFARQERDYGGAVEHALAAIAALRPGETLNVEWQVYVSASNMLAAVGRFEESEAARVHGERVGQQVIATLADEPDLQRALIGRINGQLAARAFA